MLVGARVDRNPDHQASLCRRHIDVPVDVNAHEREPVTSPGAGREPDRSPGAGRGRSQARVPVRGWPSAGWAASLAGLVLPELPIGQPIDLHPHLDLRVLAEQVPVEGDLADGHAGLLTELRTVLGGEMLEE